MTAIVTCTELLQLRDSKKEAVYALLDGASRENAFGLVFSLNGVEDYKPLFHGTRYASIMEHGPILVRVRPDGQFFRWFFAEGPACHAGGCFFSAAPLADLHVQFQDFLEAGMPDGRKALFRFYDPRITKRAITLMPEADREKFLKGITAYFVSRQTPNGRAYWIDLLTAGEDHG